MNNLTNKLRKIILPSGFYLDSTNLPKPILLNKLLATCKSDTFPNKKLIEAIKKSYFFYCIYSEEGEILNGFIRATSDKGLNVNIWNLAAQPGPNENLIYTFLICKSLEKITREMPGCSISVQAPFSSRKTLKANGFQLDPGGIRVMGINI